MPLPPNVFYHAKGMWFSWDGKPEGKVCVTYCKNCAHGKDEETWTGPWWSTPFCGEDGRCQPRVIGDLVYRWARDR